MTKACVSTYIQSSAETALTAPAKSLEIPGQTGNIPGMDDFLICVYGTRDSLIYLHQARKHVVEKGAFFFRVEINIECGNVPAGKFDAKDLPKLTFLSLPRSKITMINLITKTIWPRKRKMPSFRELTQIFQTSPQLIPDLLNHEDFAQIKVFVWETAGIDPQTLCPSPDHNGLQFAAVRKTAINDDNISVAGWYGPQPNIKF